MFLRFFKKLTHWHRRHEYVRRTIEAPVPEKNSLFHTDGWGPTRRFSAQVPAPYKGPAFPDALTSPKALPLASIAAVNKARDNWSRGHYEAARSAYEEALENAPEHPDLWFESAQLAWSRDDLSTARRKLQKADELAPDNTRVLVSLCRVAHRQNQNDDAYKLLFRASRSQGYVQEPPVDALCREMRGELTERDYSEPMVPPR